MGGRVRFFAILISLLGSTALAQSGAPRKVLLPLTVEDSQHRVINGLAVSSLQFLDNKRVPPEVSLLPAADLPLELGIVIDASGSERNNQRQEVLTTALNFAREMIRSTDDRVFFLKFDVISQVTPWLNREQLARFNLKIEFSGGPPFMTLL